MFLPVFSFLLEAKTNYVPRYLADLSLYLVLYLE